mgnify:CR=1 FL=1
MCHNTRNHTMATPTVDGGTATAVLSYKIATLSEVPLDDAVEARSLVSEATLMRAQSAEVLCGQRCDIAAQLHHNAASRLPVDVDVHPHHRVALQQRRLQDFA